MAYIAPKGLTKDCAGTLLRACKRLTDFFCDRAGNLAKQPAGNIPAGFQRCACCHILYATKHGLPRRWRRLIAKGNVHQARKLPACAVTKTSAGNHACGAKGSAGNAT